MTPSMPVDKITDETIAAIRKLGTPDMLKMADQLEAERKEYLSNTPLQKAYDAFITCYPDLVAMKDRARKLAPFDDCVLILGDTGTGKELIAKILHGDRKGAFIPINCGAIPENLIESELFGYRKGSFTGADKDRPGLIEQAENGTVFLDEIGDMPLSAQVKLLRVIQERKIRRVGEVDERNVNCRFVAATHRNIENYVKVNLFRSDLYYRINTFVLVTKPLSERSFDWPLIVKALDRENKIKNINAFCDGITKEMLGGNVRSLQQIVRKYYVLGEMI